MALTSFADNPIVGALSNALGMGPLLNPATKAATTQLQAPPVGPNETERVRESRQVRQSYPRASSRGLKPGAPAGAAMSGLPGVMSPEVLLHPETQKLLGQYGISPESLLDTANGANANLFVTNPEAFQRHPVLAGMLERGLEGAAFTQGSDTVGEGISNVARGMLDAQAARIGKFNNQLMVPFGEAQTVANLRQMAQEEKLRQAQQAYDLSHASYFDMLGNTLPEYRQQMLDLRKNELALHGQVLEQRVMQDPAAKNLTDKDVIEGQTLPQYVASVGGWQNADEGKVNQFLQMGQKHLTDTTQKNMLERIDRTSVGKVAAASVGATARSSTQGASAHIADLKATWSSAKNDRVNAERQQAAFNKDIQNPRNMQIQNPFYGRPDYPNQPKYLTRGSEALATVQAELGRLVKQAMASEGAAKQAYDQGSGSTPTATSSSVTVKAPAALAGGGHVPTYNPATGKIE